jgi:hypothetical protein
LLRNLQPGCAWQNECCESFDARLRDALLNGEGFYALHVNSCCSSAARSGGQRGFPRRSVAKWLLFETPPDRKRAVLKRSSAWYFEDCLKQGGATFARGVLRVANHPHRRKWDRYFSSDL